MGQKSATWAIAHLRPLGQLLLRLRVTPRRLPRRRVRTLRPTSKPLEASSEYWYSVAEYPRPAPALMAAGEST